MLTLTGSQMLSIVRSLFHLILTFYWFSSAYLNDHHPHPAHSSFHTHTLTVLASGHIVLDISYYPTVWIIACIPVSAYQGKTYPNILIQINWYPSFPTNSYNKTYILTHIQTINNFQLVSSLYYFPVSNVPCPNQNGDCTRNPNTPCSSLNSKFHVYKTDKNPIKILCNKTSKQKHITLLNSHISLYLCIYVQGVCIQVNFYKKGMPFFITSFLSL